MISRRKLLALAPAAGALAAAGLFPGRGVAGGMAPLSPLWEDWKSVHMTPEGRVVDVLQDSASHSEGQGYGLVLAEAFEDRETFDLLLAWSTENLATRPGDALLSWQWKPADGGAVTDTNNATDGDVMHAWALVRAARRFGEPAYLDRAGAIARDLAGKCLRPCPGRDDRTILLPGAEGFEDETGIVYNPAYNLTAALWEIGKLTGTPALQTCAADGLALLAELARDRLPPDWVHVGADGFGPAEGKSANYGYEALRLPVYLIWSGLAGHPVVRRAAAAYRPFLESRALETPTLIDPQTGEILEASPDTGYRAIAVLSNCTEGAVPAGAMPAFAAEQNYYPATLHLLSLLAQNEANLSCYA